LPNRSSLLSNFLQLPDETPYNDLALYPEGQVAVIIRDPNLDLAVLGFLEDSAKILGGGSEYKGRKFPCGDFNGFSLEYTDFNFDEFLPIGCRKFDLITYLGFLRPEGIHYGEWVQDALPYLEGVLIGFAMVGIMGELFFTIKAYDDVTIGFAFLLPLFIMKRVV
jgi:hypothetical protein